MDRRINQLNFGLKRAGRVLVIGLFLVLVIFVPKIYADFDDTGVGARPMGMGGAFVSMIDDVYTQYYNPAGLGYIRKGEMAVEYEKLHTGLSDDSNIYGGYLGLVYPWKIRTTKVMTVEKSSMTVKTERVERTRKMGTIGVGWVNFGLQDVYREDIYILSWGRRMSLNFAMGVNLKMLSQKYTQDLYTRIDPVFEYGGKDGIKAFSTDIGMIYNPLPRIFIGLVGMDLNQPDIGLKSSEKLPASIKAGIGYRKRDMFIGMDIIKKDSDMRLNSGVERWFFDKYLGVRGGFSFGSRDLRDITLGMSSDLKSFRVDYGFRFPLNGIEETSGSHRISMIFRFGLPSFDEIEPGSIEEKLITLERERKDLVLKLSDAVEMRERIEQVLVEEAMLRVKARIEAVEKEMKARRARKSVKGKKGVKRAEDVTRKKETKIKTHVVKKGETLRSIATIYYGNARKWVEIFNVNKDVVGRGGSVKPGKILLIPEIQVKAGAGAVKKTKPKTAYSKKKKAVSPDAKKKAVKKADVKKKKPVVTGSKLKPDVPRVKTGIGEKTHKVKKGETLRSIAKEVYGDSQKWKDIYMANKDKVKMGRVEEGVLLKLP